MRFSSKIGGIIKVSSSNIIAFTMSMLTSFLLPIFVSVEQYGYWQLFVMYAGYTGFFMLGFNDGVHLNYASFDYDEKLAAKFGSFKRFLFFLTAIESFALVVLLLVFSHGRDTIFYIMLLCIANILPQALLGLFAYMNQATMRFTEYARGSIFDKVVFMVLMLLMIVFGVKNALYYIAAYTISRYATIGYHWYSSRLVFTTKRKPLNELKSEIGNNFKKGFPLMIANVLHGSIIVGSRILVQNRYGIEEFSAYSFSLHTYVVAAQFIGAIATVFYPIMKRVDSTLFQKMYNSFDKIATIVSAVLLLSYFAVVIAVKIIYSKYIGILDYLLWVYPLFILSCKANILITNFYKVKNRPSALIVTNSLAIFIHMLFALIAQFVFGTVTAIACSVLLSYSLWFYLCQIYIFKKEGWRFRLSRFYDLFLVVCFVIIVFISKDLFANLYLSTSMGFVLFVLVCGIVYICFKKKIDASIREFKILLRD